MTDQPPCRRCAGTAGVWHELDHRGVQRKLTQQPCRGDAVVAVEHVVAEAELVELNRGQPLATRHRPAHTRQTLLVALPARLPQRTKVGSQLVGAADTTDDASHLDSLLPGRLAGECPGPRSRLRKALQWWSHTGRAHQ